LDELKSIKFVAKWSTLSILKSGALFLVLLLVDSCIDRIDITTPDISPTGFTVDGMITDAPGPYIVKLTHGLRLDDLRFAGEPMHAKSVTLFDSFGSHESMQETSTGVYTTQPGGIHGVIGGEYYIQIETMDGHIYASVPDRINPVGDIDSLYYEFDPITSTEGIEQQGYRIYVDSSSPDSDSTFVRWKFTGTYVVETLPQYHIVSANGVCSYDPLQCSGWALVDGQLKEGYAYNPITYSYEYVIGLKCTCCRCWVTSRETSPTIASASTHTHGKFNQLVVGYVPVNFYTFFEKYQVKVTQMSLSRNAYDFWLNVRQQREAIGSLFQPVTGKIQTNFIEGGKISEEVQGLFQASAVMTKIIYLDKNTHPVSIKVPQDCIRPPRKGAMGESCLLGFPGSFATTEKPDDWD